MSKKRSASRTIGFDEGNAEGLSLDQLAGQGYGDLTSLTRGTGKLVARLVDIFEIYPDRNQPRRPIPNVVRQGWDHDPANIVHLFTAWIKAVDEERGEPFDVDAYIRSNDEFTYNENMGPIEDSFFKVLQLAISIRRDGLTNPVTIVPIDDKFMIETGERRWLAYHLLHAYFGDQDEVGDDKRDWSKMPARTVDVTDVWRQATENSARDDLNAISKARQFSILLMDLYGTENFKPIDSFENELLFYAQVADGSQYPIPRGQGDKILNALGFKNKSQYRRHRDLLRLPYWVWQWADDLNWAEGKIRKLTSKAKNNGELVNLAALEANKTGLNIEIGNPVNVEIKKPTPKPLYTKGKKLANVQEKDRVQLLVSLGENVKNATPATKDKLIREIEAHKKWLDELASIIQTEE